MKRILLDENVPVGLVALLDSFGPQHVHALGWSGIPDADLIERAIAAGFDLLVTTDRSLPFQQNLRGLATVVLDTNNWTIIRSQAAEIGRAIAEARPGKSISVTIVRSRKPPA